MNWVEGSILLFGGLVAVMGLGLPVAFAFLVLNVIGAILFLGGEPGLAQLASSPGRRGWRGLVSGATSIKPYSAASRCAPALIANVSSLHVRPAR